MAALIRCGLLSNRIWTRPFDSLLFKIPRHGIAPAIIHKNRQLQTLQVEKGRLLDMVHRRIDYNQGVSAQLYESLTAALTQDGSLTEQNIGLLLHICSAGPFDCSTGKRLDFVEDVWAKSNEHGIVPSIKLYNIKLKAYCMNNKDFNPLNELMQMKSLGLNPDRVTYTLLIEGFCLKGDVEGANSVLEAMKTAQLTINVAVFNSFITGHLKAGSLEEANNTFELIKSSGLNPNAHTYFRFASHFAENGDVSSVTKYVDEAEEAGVPLDHLMLLDLYKAMVTAGHSKSASEFLELVSEKGIFSPLFMQKSCHLVSEGFMDAAMDLYMKMPSDEGRVVSYSGNFLLKSMTGNGYSAQDIFDTADRILEITPRALHTHRNALQFAYKADQTDLAVEILELMIAKNHEIKVAYAVPAVCSYRNQNNAEGVYKATGILLDISLPGARDDKVEQLVRCCNPALSHCGQSREDIVSRFKNHERLWNSIFFLEDIEKKGFDEALSNADGKQLNSLLFQWAEAVNSFLKYLPNETETCVKVLNFMQKQGKVEQEAINYLTSRMVRFLISQREWDSLEKMLDLFIEQKSFLVQSLKQISQLEQAPQSVRDKLDTLCTGSFGRKQQMKKGEYVSQAKLMEMSLDDLKQHQRKNPDLFLPRYVLLNKAMEANDLESIQQTLREIQALGFTLTLVSLMRVIAKLAQLKDTETASQYFEELKKLTGNSYKTTIPLMIGEEMLKQGNLEGAKEMIQAARESEHLEDDRVKSFKRTILNAMILNTTTKEDAESVHSAIFQPEPLVVENDAFIVHGSYVKKIAALCENDDGLVSTLVKIFQTYHTFPQHDFVLERLVQKKDVENLKKVMDLGNAAFGSNYFHHKLAISFIKCGMPARGATVLKTPGLKLNERLLNNNCRFLIKDKQIETLQALVNVLKEMPVSQAQMLKHLVEGYVTVGNLKQATDAVQQFAVDLNEPPRSAVEFLVQAYKKAGVEVPEALTSLSSKKNQTSKQVSSSSSESDEPTSEASPTPDQSDSPSKS